MNRHLSILVLLIVGLSTAWATGTVAQTIDLPHSVPAFNQAYTDGPDAWGNCILGTAGCPDEICTTGCLVTAFSSVLGYYGISLTVPAESSCTGEERTGMDPGIFNDWLRAQGGYGQCSQDPVGNCCLIWEALPPGVEITTHVNRSETDVSPVSSVVIDHALREGYPVIAGVHWSAYCGGSSGQSEDCHWVVITGERDGVYTIMDPYNPDSTSPYGIRTTLDKGVHGSYIVDRFVVVAQSTDQDVDVQVAASPSSSVYHVGERMRLSLRTAGTTMPVLAFARVTTPAGDVVYAVIDRTVPSGIRYSTSRASLIPNPRSLGSDWTWYDNTFHESDIGEWSWEIWVESPDDPGIRLDRQHVSYEVAPERGSLGAAVLGILLVVGIAATAFLFVLRSQ
jgi:hypothetical protein